MKVDRKHNIVERMAACYVSEMRNPKSSSESAMLMVVMEMRAEAIDDWMRAGKEHPADWILDKIQEYEHSSKVSAL